jgi:hypothetical protein
VPDRHTIVETDEVARALAPLRERGVPIDLAALVVRGARAALADLERTQTDRGLRARFLARALDPGRRGWER